MANQVEFLLCQHAERRSSIVRYRHGMPHFLQDSGDESPIHDVVFSQQNAKSGGIGTGGSIRGGGRPGDSRGSSRYCFLAVQGLQQHQAAQRF
jgi:hypothetical protein